MQVAISQSAILAGCETVRTKAARDTLGEYRDCAVRGFAVASGTDYSVVHALFAKHGRKRKRGVSKNQMDAVASEIGLVYVRFTRPITWARVRRMVNLNGEPRAYWKSGHVFAGIGPHLADFETVKDGARVRGYYVKAVTLQKGVLKNDQ